MTETSGLPPQAPPQQPPAPWGSPDPRGSSYPPPLGQQPYSEPPYGQPPYGQQAYSQPPYSQPQHNRPQYPQYQQYATDQPAHEARTQPPYGQAPRPQRWATRPFLRSRDDRLVAGVAGGVGRSLGIDPLILRVLVVVLAFFGGAGILLYALGWLLLDLDDGRGRSLVEDAFDRRRPNRGRNLLTVAALAFTVFLCSIWLLSGRLVPVTLIVLTVVALLLYARRDTSPPPYPQGAVPGWFPPPPGQPYPGQPDPGPSHPGPFHPGPSNPGPSNPGQPSSGPSHPVEPSPGPSHPGQPYPGQPTEGAQPSTEPPYGVQPVAPGATAGGATPADTEARPHPDTPGAGSMHNQSTVVLPSGTEPTATLDPESPPAGSHRYDPSRAPHPPSATHDPAWPPQGSSPAAAGTSSGQPVYGATTYGQPTYGQPGYGQRAYGQPAYEPPGYGSPLGFGEPPGPPPGQPPGYGPPPPPAQRRQRDRSYLGLLTLSAAMLALGVLAAVDVAYAAVPGSAYVVLALAIVAAGLLVGTWVGRSRGLIVAGVLLSAALVPVVVVDAATDEDWSRIGEWSNAETRREMPTDAAAIQPAYDIDSGRLVLDLRGVDFTGADVTTSVSVGAGEILVLVPPDVDVVARGSVDIGDLVLFGAESSGLDSDRAVTSPGIDTLPGEVGELDLTMDVNVGSAEVRR